MRGNLSTTTKARGTLNVANEARRTFLQHLDIHRACRDDVGDRDFAFQLIRHADDRGLGDAGLFDEKLLDFCADRC